ncbi:MAG TPA: protein phosphatase [Chloroflexi bacterium]|nr:protein phosphatase [Chloroflexota bacterium]HBY06848.1 protein phosphatase [Chloroflexota bacterium]
MTNFFGKLFGKLKKAEEETPASTSKEMLLIEDDATKPLEPLPEMLSSHVLNEESLDLPQLFVGNGQSVGMQRDHNEDALFSLTTTLANNASNLSFGLYIVADGMGGHQHGEVASEIATRAMAEYVVRHLYTPLLSVTPEPPAESLQEILANGVQAAHNGIIDTISGGGTTLSTVLILGKQMIIAHVGDSRIYSIDLHGNMRSLTRDHSLVKRLEELGQLTPDEAAIHPQRNVLYRALGQGEPFEPEIITTPLPHSGFLLLCSDGLWGVVPEKELGKIIITASTPQLACQQMIDAANAAGGPDNITAILVRLPD